jgi:hypothetical protein
MATVRLGHYASNPKRFRRAASGSEQCTVMSGCKRVMPFYCCSQQKRTTLVCHNTEGTALPALSCTGQSSDMGVVTSSGSRPGRFYVLQAYACFGAEMPGGACTPIRTHPLHLMQCPWLSVRGAMNDWEKRSLSDWLPWSTKRAIWQACNHAHQVVDPAGSRAH